MIPFWVTFFQCLFQKRNFDQLNTFSFSLSLTEIYWWVSTPYHFWQLCAQCHCPTQAFSLSRDDRISFGNHQSRSMMCHQKISLEWTCYQNLCLTTAHWERPHAKVTGLLSDFGVMEGKPVRPSWENMWGFPSELVWAEEHQAVCVYTVNITTATSTGNWPRTGTNVGGFLHYPALLLFGTIP